MAGVAAFAGCSALSAEAFAHGRRHRGVHGGAHGGAHAGRHGGRHAGRRPRHETGRPLADAEPQPAEFTTPASQTVAPANLDTLGRLDPNGLIRKPLLAAAIVAMDRHKDRIADPGKLFIADFSKHSSQPRLYSVDMKTGEVTAFRTAHGRGSDPNRSGWARRFSNQPGSFASSLGAYVTLGESFGLRHGRHIGLDGLDPSNSNAKDRAIIVHSAEYCEIPFLRAFGMLGRSEGCFATSSKEFVELMPAMGEGRLLYAGV